eukprot:SAG31_NODE_2218_length_6159_cov_3.265182_4_plen_190_part_00
MRKQFGDYLFDFNVDCKGLWSFGKLSITKITSLINNDTVKNRKVRQSLRSAIFSVIEDSKRDTFHYDATVRFGWTTPFLLQNKMPSKMGRLTPMFSLPRVLYAQPGTLVQNARFLRDGTGVEGKPRAVYTVPIPAEVLHGRGIGTPFELRALGAVCAVAATSVALLGDGMQTCKYDLWMHDNAQRGSVS